VVVNDAKEQVEELLLIPEVVAAESNQAKGVLKWFRHTMTSRQRTQGRAHFLLISEGVGDGWDSCGGV